MTRTRLIPWVLLALMQSVPVFAAPTSSSTSPTQPAPPPTRTEAVVDKVFGVEVSDSYRWMEKADAPEFIDWVKAQGVYARQRLDAIPERGAILARVRELSLKSAGTSRIERAGSMLFILRTDAGASLPKLIVLDASGAERVLLDPATTKGESGGHLSIDNLAPSPDGKRIACNLAEGGGEITKIHVLDSATGKAEPDVIEHIWGEFAVSWAPDGSGFFYTQMAKEAFTDPNADKLQNMQVRYHRLGTSPEKDPVLLGRGINPTMPFEPREFPSIWVPRGSAYAMAFASGARSESRLYITRLTEAVGPGAKWKQVAGYEDLVESVDVHGGELYLLSSKNSPNRRILRVPAKQPDLAAARVLVAESSEAVLTSIVAAKDALYYKRMEKGIDTIWRLPYGAAAPEPVALPSAGACFSMTGYGDEVGLSFPLEGWTEPRTWYQFLPGESKLRDLGIRTTTPADYSGIVVESVEVPSFDGAVVPLTILHRRDLRLDGSHATLLVGYGGYGDSQQPSFSATRLAWLERGGVLAMAAVRGGGEKGRAWYLGGKGANKKNGIRDFIACGEALCSKGYTSPARLSAMGVSMGGVLIGGAITERPDLFGAAVIRVGILNTVRILEGTNGSNQVPELGDPTTEEGFRTLREMDAYQKIRDGVAYPAVLLEVGLNDQRVSPWHSAKFGARLQAASKSGKPVLMRSDTDSGHGIGSTREQFAELNADIYSFLFSQLGAQPMMSKE